jgi:hypothetical protein
MHAPTGYHNRFRKLMDKWEVDKINMALVAARERYCRTIVLELLDCYLCIVTLCSCDTASMKVEAQT